MLEIITYPDEVAEAIRDLVWSELGEELGLLRCQQDQREGFPLDELAARLPAVLIRVARLPAPRPDIPEAQTRAPWQAWQVDYAVDVIYAQELALTGEPNRDFVRAAGKIRDLFLAASCLADLDPTGGALGGDGGPGFVLSSVSVGDVTPNSGTLAVDSRALWIGEAVVPVTVSTVAYPVDIVEEVS